MKKTVTVILILLISAVMFSLNSAVLSIIFGISMADQLDTLASLVFAGSFPEKETAAADINVVKQGDAYYISLDAISLMENMDLQDKLKAASILCRVDQDILNSAAEMAKDGITYDEYDELKEWAKAYLSPSDLETLREILDKYGGSYAQGGD